MLFLVMILNSTDLSAKFFISQLLDPFSFHFINSNSQLKVIHVIILGSIFPASQLKGIINRNIQYREYYHYYILNKKPPKSSICFDILYKLHRYPNPHHFDYCMDPQLRDIYIFPFILSTGGTDIANTSSICILNTITR